ncbi:carboxypeptidase-like regulatory domain-containing protein [Candidatus Woesearchaeota archaeon]|nr:carboxypeptidase-like regulatory domain-containing protein [Candidatus Woesearchaeota archaeon]
MEKRAIVAKILALVSILIVFIISIPSASAQIKFDVLDKTLGQFHKILGMDGVVFGVLVFLFFFLMYGIFALGLSRSKAFSKDGKLTKNAKVVALSLAGIVILSTFFVRKNVLSFAKNTLAPQFNLFFAVILSVLMFMLFRWLGRQTFRNRQDMADVFGIFSVGLALSMFGAIGEAKWAEGLGLVLIIISAIWLLVLILAGSGEDRDERRRRDEGDERRRREEGRVATIYGTGRDMNTGDPIRGATVTVNIPGVTPARSLRDGSYHLWDLPLGDNVRVSATADGYQEFHSEPINLQRDRRLDIPMATGEQSYNINVIVRDAITGIPIDREADTRFYVTTPHEAIPIEVPAEFVHYQGNGRYILTFIYVPGPGCSGVPNFPTIWGASCRPDYDDNIRAVTVDDITNPIHIYEIELTPHSPPGGGRDVRVEVIDAAHGTRIVNAGTRLYLGLPGATPRQLTAGEYTDDGSGVYTIPEATINPVFPLGGAMIFTIGASSPGFPQNEAAVSIDYTGPLHPIYQIPLGGAAGTFSITGRVTDRNGPVDAVRVEFRTHHANTNAAGNYTISGIPNTEADPAAILTVSKTDYQTATFTRGLNPGMANTHDLQINRYTFRAFAIHVPTGAIHQTINDPYTATNVNLAPGEEYTIRLEADPTNGRFDPATPPAERIFEIAGVTGFTPINFTIVNENRAELEHSFILPPTPSLTYIFDIRMIDR